MKSRSDMPGPSDEALKEIANVARRVLTRPGDELSYVFLCSSSVAEDGQRHQQAMMWPTGEADDIREFLRVFVEGGLLGRDGSSPWEER